MKTIIVGYTDRGALSAPEIIFGPETPPAVQARIMEDAKRLHKFPENISRVEQYALGEPVETAIFVSEEVAKVAQGIDAGRKQKERENRERVALQVKAQANIILANKAFSAAAKKRNEAIAAVAAQKNLLSANITDKDRNNIVKRINELQPLVEQAIAEFQVVHLAHDVIKNPKSLPEDVASALQVIKEPAAELKAAADKAAADKAAADKAAADKAAADKAAADKAAADKAAADSEQAQG